MNHVRMDRLSALLAFGVVLAACGPMQAQENSQAKNAGVGDSPNVLRFDASKPLDVPETGYLHVDYGRNGGEGKSHNLAVNNRYLTLDGQPWLPVMGEFHFSRYPEAAWETEILKMKGGGIQIIATYIFWIHHEEAEGQFDWSGQRDLHRFIELCGKHGMYVYLRIGPWAHGEVRNGGFPDWLASKTQALRQNDPVYLKYVDRLYGEIGRQAHGLLWSEGGPVIGVQLENEYSISGPLGGSAHILKLKQMAIENGLEVPLYSVTGWPNRDFPPHEVVPVLGGYPDGFWDGSLHEQPPSEVYLFNFRRSSGDMGAIAGTVAGGTINMEHYPYFEAEAGGGMAASYHRRPLVQPDDIAALTLTGIGSGVNLYGYYMFHGGANPDGRLSTLQESQATGYPNDLPVRTYDFQAPLGEFGQVRESYRKLKIIHLFLNAFGSYLAPMPAIAPDRIPANAADTALPRASLRQKGGRGFLFVSNYSRKLSMPERKQFQAVIDLGDHAADRYLKIPAKPVSVPANSYFIWPFNLDMNTATLRYSTAQLLTRIDDGGIPTYLFFEIPGVPAEFLFDAHDTRTVEAKFSPGAARSVAAQADGVYIHDLVPGNQTVLNVTASSGAQTRIILLTEAEAENAWKVNLGEADHVILAAADVFSDGSKLDLRSTDLAKFNFKVLPDLKMARPTAAGRVAARQPDGIWSRYSIAVMPANLHYTLDKVRSAVSVPPVRMGPYVDWRKGSVAQAPEDDVYKNATEWQFRMQPLPLEGISEAYLRIPYVGDAGRMYLAGKLLDDNFYNGTTWEVGLKRFFPGLFDAGVRIDILPIARSAPIYLDAEAWQRVPLQGFLAELGEVSVVPEYEVVLNTRAEAGSL